MPNARDHGITRVLSSPGNHHESESYRTAARSETFNLTSQCVVSITDSHDEPYLLPPAL